MVGQCKVLTFRPALSTPFRRFIDQEIIELLSTLHCINKPTRSCPATCPRFARRTAIFRRNLSAFQRACPSPTATASFAAYYRSQPVYPLQLLFDLRATFEQSFVNPLAQVHERFDVHP